jgi:hypothetical protein
MAITWRKKKCEHFMSDEINKMKRSESLEMPKRGICVLVSDEILQVSYFLHYFILSWRKRCHEMIMIINKLIKFH